MDLSITPVKSSNIEGYAVVVNADSKDLSLYIKFNTGSLYVYHNVPERVLVEFVDAESKGKYFAKNIKTQYEFEKVSTDNTSAVSQTVN